MQEPCERAPGVKGGMGVRRAWWRGKTGKYVTTWGSWYMWRWAHGAGIQGPEAKTGVGRVLVWEGPTVQRVSVCEAGVNVQAGPRNQCKALGHEDRAQCGT